MLLDPSSEAKGVLGKQVDKWMELVVDGLDWAVASSMVSASPLRVGTRDA